MIPPTTSTPTAPPAWTQSKERVSFHEVGHAIVDQLAAGTTEGCCVTMVDGEWVGVNPPLEIKTGFKTMSREEGRNYLAGLWGGWAAVNIAITTGLLPREPVRIEAVPGDRGFLGGPGSDDDWIKKISAIVYPADPAGLADEARQLALGLLRPRMTAAAALADQLAGRGFLAAEDIADALK